MNKLKTPCYIFDRKEFTGNITGFQRALKNNFHKSVVGYSVKTNSLPYLLSLAKESGGYAEVVSSDEYHLALACGFDKHCIIYNGPLKSKETFLDAIMGGAIVNIETGRELEWLKELPKGKTYSVGLRLNLDISEVSPDDADGQNDDSRFGFSDDTDDFANAVTFIAQIPNVSLAGIHLHRNCHTRSLRFYRESVKYACQTIDSYNLKLNYLDVGGGYFGPFQDNPTFDQYAEAFGEITQEYGQDDLCIAVEPGNAIVASCFTFVSEVIDVKHIKENRWIVTIDGMRSDVDPFFRKKEYINEFVSDGKGETVQEQVICGSSCLEGDRLFTLQDHPLLKVGDRILFRNVGAYTMCLSPLFIRYFPDVYERTGEGYELIREKWTEKEYITKNKMYR